jgi:hypothetical protein
MEFHTFAIDDKESMANLTWEFELEYRREEFARKPVNRVRRAWEKLRSLRVVDIRDYEERPW